MSIVSIVVPSCRLTKFLFGNLQGSPAKRNFNGGHRCVQDYVEVRGLISELDQFREVL